MLGLDYDLEASVGLSSMVALSLFVCFFLSFRYRLSYYLIYLTWMENNKGVPIWSE